MKPKLFLILFCAISTILSCTKNAGEKISDAPQWLQDKISYMDKSEYYAIVTVTLYEWNNQYYYFIQNPLSSCYTCEFYQSNGEVFKWPKETNFEDFNKNAKKIKVVWQRGW